MTKRIVKKLRYVFIGIGIVLLVALIRKIGVQTILDNMAQVGWRFVPIMLLSFCWYALYTTGWMQFLNRLSDGIGFWDLFRIKITGEAVNTLTPANFIGGDPMRIYLLRKNFPLSEGAASVVVDRTLASTAIITVVLMGVIVAFMTFDRLPANLKYGVPIAVIVCIGFIAFVLIHQRRGFFSLMLDACRRLGIKREFSDKTIGRFRQLDGHITEFYRANHRGFIIALLCHVGGRFLGVLEVYAVGRAVSDEFTFFAALMLTALAPMINVVFAFIPGAFGVMEGAYSGVLYLMNLDPAIGITIQIAKRLRAAFWIALGLLFLGAHDRKKVWEEERLIEEV
ncbi:MAG TPA: lysylphosphatidylglycerol synthase transmembrane domain-containing protein [bacterium]|nr:lysylphosphatidylglycerol synthase transmembrane domain-containing protein [bacterium]